MPGQRGGFFGWAVAFAALALTVGAVELGRSSVFAPPELRSAHADPAKPSIPPDMMVIVAEEGKTFHRAGCPFMHDKTHLQTIPANQAIREGYAPCVRCMHEYQASKSPPQMDPAQRESAHASLDLP